MHRLHCQPPSLDLQPYVRMYAQREISDVVLPVVERVPARLEQTLEFQFGEPFLVGSSKWQLKTPLITIIGSHTEGDVSVKLDRGVISFGVFFTPIGASQLFGIPACELTNRSFDACDILPAEIRRLYEEMAVSNGFKTRISIVERFLRRCAERQTGEFTRDYEVLMKIFHSGGAGSMTAHAALQRVSLRQFERRISKAIGIQPKQFARVARFQTALDAKLLAPHRSWLDISHSLGYHDQMHMVHDFQKLGNCAPNELVMKIGDMRPPAMQAFSQF